MNVVILVGRYTKDVEIRYSNDAQPKAIARYTIAVDDDFNKEHTDFINGVAFGKTAEIMDKYTKKGSMVVLLGKWQVRQWDNSEGKKQWSNEFVANRIKLIGGKSEGNSAPSSSKADEGFYPIDQNIEDDELPF